VTAGNPFICPRQTPLMGAFADAFTFMFCKSAHAPKMTKAIPISMDFQLHRLSFGSIGLHDHNEITPPFREEIRAFFLSADEKRSTVPVSTSSL
jgi:hypothetical protein